MSYLWKKRFLVKFANAKNYRKVRDHCDYTDKYSGKAHSTCNLKFNVPDEKYRTFCAAIEKEVTNIDKDSNESVATISYKIQFIDSVTFLVILLSNIIGSLPEGIHKIKWKDYA